MTVTMTKATVTTLPEALREAAELLAKHPDLPAPYVTSSSNGTVVLSWYLQYRDTQAEQKNQAARIVKTIGGKWDKGTGDWSGPVAEFDQTIGLLRLHVVVQREAVCERVVTGKETVTIPAKPAEPERTVEREIVEWRCEPVLAGAS